MTSGKEFLDDEDEGDDDEKERGGEGNGTLGNWIYPIGCIFGREEDKKHREWYPDRSEAKPRSIYIITHFVSDEREEKKRNQKQGNCW